MGGYRKLDTTGRGKQLEGWFKCDREDCTRAYKRVGVPSAGGSYVCHHINSVTLPTNGQPVLLACSRPLKP